MGASESIAGTRGIVMLQGGGVLAHAEVKTKSGPAGIQEG